MADLSTTIKQVLAGAELATAVRAALLFAISLVLARVLAGVAARTLQRASAQHQMLGRRIAFYGVLGLGLVLALHQLGFDLSTLLGAAGIATLALGFAAQTSASNFIAGLFLIGERPFVIGDVVRIGDITGEVLSVDLLSVKLRTLDNLYVRVPNELAVKTEVWNLTHFPIRRVELQVGVSYATDLTSVRTVLMQVASDNPLCLEEPKPVLLVSAFGESAIDLKLWVWCTREHIFEVQTALHEQIKLAFEREHIDIPFPQRRIQTPTEPWPVTIVGKDEDGPA